MRAQIKMFETFAVLVIFFVLLIGGISFYFGVQKSQLEKERVSVAEKNAFQVALRALYTPELDCSFLSTRREQCLDKLKVVALSELLLEDQPALDYFGRFGFSTITVRQVWPDDSSFSGVVLYSREPVAYQGNVSSLNPVLLFDPWKNAYAFGVLEVVAHVG